MRQDFQSGLGLAQGFMGNYWKAKETQVEQERYRAGQALRDVQLSLYQTNLETVRNAAALDAQVRAAAPGLYGLAANAQANSWNAESKLKVLEYITANPALGNTDIAKGILNMFSESEKYSQQVDLLERSLQNKIDVKQIGEGQQPGFGGTVPVTTVKTKSGKEVDLYFTGSTWQPLDKNEIDPSETAVPIIDKTGKPLPGAYTFGGKILRAPDSVYSVFGSGGGGQAAPASTAVAPGDTKAPTVLKFDKTGKPIK